MTEVAVEEEVVAAEEPMEPVAHNVCGICYPDWMTAAPGTLKGMCGAPLIGIPATIDHAMCEACLLEREEHFFEHWCEEKEL